MKTFTTVAAAALNASVFSILMLLCAAERSPELEFQLRPPAKSSNILAFFPTEVKSHFTGFKLLLETLVNRGHNVTLVSPYPLDGAKLPYRYVEVEKTKTAVDMLQVAKYMNAIPAAVQTWWFGPYVSELALNKTAVTEFVAGDRGPADVVLFENFFHECFAALGHKYGAPTVQLVPFAAGARVSQWHGNPYDPAYVPDAGGAHAANMTFAQRAANAAAAFAYTALSRAVYLPRHRALAARYLRYPGHERRPDLADALRNVSLTLVNSHPVIGSPAPAVPTFVDVAGMHCVPARPLPEDLKQIMENSERGVVYFSLGSVVKSSNMPKETVSLLLSELSKIEQTVLWKWEADEIPQLPKNVFVRKWFPQNDILGHPNCTLFITHGGVHSVIESVYHGVPMLAVPVFGDQQGNSLRAQYRGLAIQVPYFDLTHESFGSALHKLLNDPTYRENAKKSSAVFRDNPLPPLEKAVYWIEYVARHGGTAHLRTAANDLYWFQRLLLDVLLVAAAVVVACLWTTKTIFGFVFRRCCGRKHREVAAAAAETSEGEKKLQ